MTACVTFPGAFAAHGFLHFGRQFAGEVCDRWVVAIHGFLANVTVFTGGDNCQTLGFGGGFRLCAVGGFIGHVNSPLQAQRLRKRMVHSFEGSGSILP
ncbi:MAG: hypothetical protein CMN19_16095 [Roseovarius sp.]|nr:hypothetical protein [Roseovarius sp.]